MKRKTFLSAIATLAMASTTLAIPLTPGNLVVSRVGDGMAAPTSAAAAVFLEEFTIGGVPTQTLPMPTVVNGGNRRFTNSGTATSEGTLTLSADGRFLMLGGYDADPGMAGVVGTTSAAVNRVVGRVDNLGNIDTTTALTDAYSTNNIRSVTSTNGTDIWTAGTAAAANGPGVRYTTLGSGTSTQLSTTVINTRVVNIANSQLYVSTMSGAFRGVNTVGVGLPTTSGQTTTLLNGFDPSTTSPESAYDYFFADARTLYVADDRGTATGGGLQKWTEAGGVWTLQYTLTTNLTAGLRGLTGVTDPTGAVTLYAVTADAAPNKLVAVTDLGAASPFSTLATAPANTNFRGVDFAPVPEPTTMALLAMGVVAAIRRRRNSF